MTIQTNGDELERKKFEEWWSSYFTVINTQRQTHLYETVKCTAWLAWLARSKQEKT